MPRKESEAVPESNGPLPWQEEFGSGQPTLEDGYRMLCEAIDSRFDRQQSCFDRWDRKMDEISDEMRRMDQHVTSLKHGARQPHLAMEADGPANTKTRERTEGVATAEQAVRGDGFPACRVEPGPNTNSTSFGGKAKSPALPCRDDVVVESGDAAPKSCLPSLEMCTSTAAGGLVPTGEASTATETNFNQPPLRFHSTEETDSEASLKETNLRTSTQHALYDSSIFQESNLLLAPSSLRVIETKPMKNMTFDPGGPQGRLRACPSLEWWPALVCGEVLRGGAVLWRIGCSRLESLQESRTSKILCRTYNVFSEEIH